MLGTLSNKNRRQDHSLDVSVVLPENHDPRFVRRVVLLVVAGLLGTLVWAGNTPVREITTGRGTLVAEAEVERIEHPDGGVVSELHIVQGQFVKPGTVLLTFDTSSTERELSKLEATLQSLLVDQQRVKGMLLNTQVRSSTSNLLPESALFWAEQEYLEAKLDLLDSTRESAQHTLAILIKRRANIESEVTILVNRLNRIRSGFDSGIFSRIELERIQREVLQLKRVLLELDTEIEVQRRVLEETQLRREELRTERRRESALRQLEIEERITQVNLSIQELKVRIERATIVAATEGKVMVVTVVSQNEVIAPNELIAEIVPTDSALRAEIEISADRVGSLEPGMEARLKVLSYDFTRYGEIVGRIKDISPTSFPNQSGQTVYLVDVEIPGEGLPSGRKVRSGMTVTADILSEQKMILAYLLKPLRALSDRAFTEA